jgi:hypothetical protein
MLPFLLPGPQPGGGGGGSAPAARTEIILGRTGNPAAGSTNNRVPLFNVDAHNNGGADFTRTHSATLGSYFTIVTPGLYFAQGSVVGAANNGSLTIRVGASVINTSNVGSSNLLEYPIGFSGIDTSWYPNISGFIPLTAGQLVYLLTNAAIWTSNTDYNAGFKFGLFGPF